MYGRSAQQNEAYLSRMFEFHDVAMPYLTFELDSAADLAAVEHWPGRLAEPWALVSQDRVFMSKVVLLQGFGEGLELRVQAALTEVSELRRALEAVR